MTHRKSPLNLDDAVKRHNRKAVAGWLRLAFITTILMVLMMKYLPGLVYKTTYEKHVRQTVLEVLTEVNQMEIDRRRAEVEDSLNELEDLIVQPGTPVHRAHDPQGSGGQAGEDQDGPQ